MKDGNHYCLDRIHSSDRSSAAVEPGDDLLHSEVALDMDGYPLQDADNPFHSAIAGGTDEHPFQNAASSVRRMR
jgi:hypothetical protein